MIDAIRRFFEARIAGPGGDGDGEQGYRLATAALLVEVGRADYQVRDDELATISGAVRKAFGLTPQETDELVDLALQEARQATSLYDFTRLVNERFSPDEKAHVLELLWEVAYADGDLDKYEEHLIRRIAELLHLPHSTFIQAKLRVAERSPPRH